MWIVLLFARFKNFYLLKLSDSPSNEEYRSILQQMNAIEYRFPVVIDNGSFSTHIGFVGETQPRTTIPTLVSKNSDDQKTYYGKQALIRLCDSRPIFPVVQGRIENYEKLIELWKQEFEALKIQPQNSPLLISDQPETQNRAKLAEMLFELLKVPSVYFEYPAVLSLFGAGLLTGMGFDSGHSSTQVIPVFNGKVLDDAIVRVQVGGQTLTQKLGQSLQIQFPFNNFLMEEILRDIKETYCVMPLQNKVAKQIKIPRPDGQIISILQEKYSIPESLILQYDLHKLPIKCLKLVEPELRKQIFEQVVFCGGNMKIKNLQRRLGEEIFNCSPPRLDFGAFYSDDCQLLAWKGGSILGSLSSFSQIWITLSQYKEEGLNALKRHSL